MEWGQEAGEGTQAGKEKQVQRRREEGPPTGVGSGPECASRDLPCSHPSGVALTTLVWGGIWGGVTLVVSSQCGLSVIVIHASPLQPASREIPSAGTHLGS